MTVTTKGKEKEHETSLFSQKKPRGSCVVGPLAALTVPMHTKHPQNVIYFLLGISKIQERWPHRNNGLPRWRELMAFEFCAQHVW